MVAKRVPKKTASRVKRASHAKKVPKNSPSKSSSRSPGVSRNNDFFKTPLELAKMPIDFAKSSFDFAKVGIQKIEFPGQHKHPSKMQAPKLARIATTGAQSVITELNSTPNGILQKEADLRLKIYGPNSIAEQSHNPIIAFLKQFMNPLVILLLAAAVIAHYSDPAAIDAYIIIAIVFFSVIINFVQEFRAVSAASKLKDRVATTVRVIRDGEERELPIAKLVPGDIVLLHAGDLVPADCRIIESKDLFVNQSSLTGESLPAEKHAPTLEHSNLSLSELTNIVFMGSSVVSGTARALVVETGGSTTFGRIAQDLAAAPIQSEFDRGIKSFSFLVIRSIVLLVIFIFVVLAVVKHEYLQAVLFSIAVAIGLTPDLLPMILSVNMARGSVNMAKKGVIVKKLQSIPNFGSMDVLCTDKTGTLTQDHIALVKYIDLEGKEDDAILIYTYLNSSYQTGIRNPLDRAVLEFKKPDFLKTLDYTKVDEIPFDFVRRRVSIIVKDKKEKMFISKGAPEEILKVCSHVRLGNKNVALDYGTNKIALWKHYTKLSEEGYRVLAVAVKKLTDGDKKVYRKDDESDMTLVGFVAFLDPPKHDVKHTLADLHRMGIEIKVVTGDNELVTKKICQEIGLDVKGVLLGSEVDAYSDADLAKKVEITSIFARFSPSQKNRIILALKKNGHVVGYLGDGINDAPSLRSADVGISVQGATDVAKESADMILTHKSLRELKDGVIEGRKTFGNSMKYLMMSISSNFGNMFSVAGAVVMLPFLPMLPVMILFTNLLYDVSQVTIPSDGVDEEYIQRPKKWDTVFITRFMYVFGPLSAVFDFITFGVLYFVFGTPAAIFQTGWFLESLATQTLVIHILRTKKTPFIESRASKWVTFSTIGIVIVGWCVPFTPLGTYLGFKPIPAQILFALAGIVLAYLVVVQSVKVWFYKKYDF